MFTRPANSKRKKPISNGIINNARRCIRITLGNDLTGMPVVVIGPKSAQLSTV